MTGYTARRLLLIVPTVLIVSIIIFVIFHLLPGDAALIQVTEGGTSSISVKQYERALEELGLDRPPVERYADWIWGLLQGDGGNSLVTGQPVFKELAKSLPVTLELAILASIMGIAMSIPIGVMSAVKQDGAVGLFGAPVHRLRSCPAQFSGRLHTAVWSCRCISSGFHPSNTRRSLRPR